MLKIYLDETDSDVVDRTFGVALQSLRPSIPEHEFSGFTPGYLPPAPKGTVVLVCGPKVAGELQARGMMPKNRSYRSLRETVIPSATGGFYMLTHDGAESLNKPDELSELIWDVRLATRLMLTNSLNPKIGVYKWVGSFQPMIDRITKAYEETGQRQDISADLETMGLDPYREGSEIVSISFTYEPGTAEVLYTGPKFDDPVQTIAPKDLLAQIDWLLNSPMVTLRMANGKFDMMWMREKWGLTSSQFLFDPCLVGSLLDENRSCSLNFLTKMETPLLGGYDDCVAPHVRLLMADMTWKAAGEVQPGEALVGFDEEAPGGSGHRRRMRLAKAVSTKRLVKPGVRIRLSNGTVIECSDDHGFLSPRGSNGGSSLWRRAYQLKPGDRLKAVAPVIDYDESREAGYLAGIFDGEGYVSRSGAGLCSGWSQRPGLVQERIVKAMQVRGLEYYVASQRNGDGVITCKGAAWETLKMLQMLQPSRLVASLKWDGFTLPQEPEPVTVVAIEDLGPIEVVSLETDVHTFVAEGIASHNSFNKTHDKSHFELIPPDDKYLVYAGGDTDATQQVSTRLKDKLLKQPALARFYVKLLHPAARTFEQMERRGILVDRERFEIVRDEVKVAIKENTEVAMSLIPRRIRMKYLDKIEAQIAQGKSPITPEMKAEYFFGPLGLKLKPKMTTAKTGKPSTSAKHFEQYEDVPEAVAMTKALKALSQAEKVLSTYIDGFLKHLRDDGRFHPSYFLFHGSEGWGNDEGGTVTGRLSAIDPAIQTLPKHSYWGKRLRWCLIAPEGYVYFETDFSQGELRVAACIANEKNMIAAYKEGMDLHGITGALAAGLTYDDVVAYKKSSDKKLKALAKEIRQKGKAGNFGLLYGMSAEGFQVYAKLNYGVDMTLAEATAFREKFLYEQFPALPKYHQKYKQIAKNTGQVVSPLGRVRHLPLANSMDGYLQGQALRQAINAPVQSTLSDMMLLALTRIEQELSQEEVMTNMVIHDAAVGYVKASKAVSLAKDVQEIMSTLPLHEFGWEPQLDFVADYSLGIDFGSMMEADEADAFIEKNGPEWYLATE